MKPAPLTRKLLRDLWRIKWQALAIGLVIGCGVAMFVMTWGTTVSLHETRMAYYEREAFAHVFAGAKRAPLHLAQKIAEIEGVQTVATRIVLDAMLDIPGMGDPAIGRVTSLPSTGVARLNRVYLRSGRTLDPTQSNEVLVGEAFAQAHGYVPGDQISAVINGRKRNLIIVGIALSPEFLYTVAPGAMVPDNKRYGALWMGRSALAAAFDMDGAFNDVVLSLRRDASLAAVIARLDQLLKPYGGVGAYGRKDQVSNWYLNGELKQLRAMGIFAPPIFLGVAAFLLNIVVTRLVETEREQIGLLKAVGYTDWAVAGFYLKLIMSVAMFGILAGMGVGAWLGWQMVHIYAEFFRFPYLEFRLEAWVFAVALLISLAAALVGALRAVLRAAHLPPAVAMQPSPPVQYRKSLFETFVLQRGMSEPTRMIVRYLGRWPLRTALTTLGISMGVAVLIASMFFIDAMDVVVETFYNRSQRQDVTVTFTQQKPRRIIGELARMDGVLRVEPMRAAPVRFVVGARQRRGAIIGVAPDATLNQMLDTDLKPIAVPLSGLVLSRKMTELLNVGAGDWVRLEVLEGRRPVRRVRVMAVIEEFVGLGSYMNLAALNRLMGEGDTVSGAYLQVNHDKQNALFTRLKSMPAIASVSLRTAELVSFRKTMAESIMIMTTMNMLFAGLIAFGVIYNAVRISLSERGRELASLRVLGFTRAEVSYVLLGELAVLTLLAIPLGYAIGYGIAYAWTLSLDTELYRIPLVIERATYAQAALVVILSALASGWVVKRRLDQMDLISVLKTRE